jgi:tRNA pseudouridine13 synthase
MRLMYIHAYQSYVWNMAASERIRIGGKSLKPICGDLVYDKTKEGKFSYNIIKLDSKNIDSYSIEDVVLPLPGHNILYPNNQSS